MEFRRWNSGDGIVQDDFVHEQCLVNMINDTALALRQYKTVFYTGHCTGATPYNAMKKLMGDQLRYVHSGDEIRIRTGIEETYISIADCYDNPLQYE